MRLFRTKYPNRVKANCQVWRSGTGVNLVAPQFELGDFILVHSTTLAGRIVSLGQRLRFWGSTRPYTWWNHAALIVDQQGLICEALWDGVHYGEEKFQEKYKNRSYAIVHLADPTHTTREDRDEAVAYATWAKGIEYAYATIISIAICLLSGGKFKFFVDGQTTCSGLVARALERTKIIFDGEPSHIMPAELALKFGVKR